MNTRLYVGNLSFNTTADGVRTAFQEFGTVSDVHLVTDRETGRSRGFAFVTMATDELAQEAIRRMDGNVVGGRPLRVNEATDTMREMLTAAMSVNLSLVTVAQGEIVKRLAGWAALLAAPTLIASWYGMNFEHMQELSGRYSYWVLIGGTDYAGIWLEAKDGLTPLGPQDAQVTVEEGKWLVFRPTGVQPTTGFIFYPGGRVDHRAYAPPLRAVMEQHAHPRRKSLQLLHPVADDGRRRE